MKLYLFEFVASSRQYNPFARIRVAHVCLSKAYEMAEEAAGCALSLCAEGFTERYNEPCVVLNTFE